MKSGNSERPSDREAIEATAAAWLAARDDGLSLEEEAGFARWRAADPRHAAAVARLERTWAALQQLREFRPEARRHPDRDLLARRSRVGRVVRFPAIATAALAAALAVMAAWWLNGGMRADNMPQRYATAADGYESVTLEDGSLLQLNSSTEVGVRFTPSDRRVWLLRGEAHFTVAKDPARPFSIEAGSVTVRAIGTAFNVRLGAGDVEVLVTEGKVEVIKALGLALLPVRQAQGPERVEGPGRNGAAADRAGPSRGEHDDLDAPPPADGRPMYLSANERVIIPTSRLAAPAPPVVEKITPEAVRKAFAWQEPPLVFSNTPLADVVEQFNRRNAVQLVIAEDDLRALPVGGSFRAENVRGFVRLLDAGGDIVADRSDPHRIVLRRNVSQKTK